MWSMRGGVASPGAIGVAGLVPGLDGIEDSLIGEGNGRTARTIGSPLSDGTCGVRGCLRTERDRSDCDGRERLSFGVGGV